MRKQLHYVTLFLLFFNAKTLTGENYVDTYINTYKDIAIREMMRSGIPASIILAQGIHESSWGKGDLALNSNNHFGIKCKSYWKGPTFYYEDDDYDSNGKLTKSCFRAYENPEKSYIDHTDFLMTTEHYQELFNYDHTDYIRWAKGLKKCGYATDKEYANKLIRTIETYKLNKFDSLSETTFFVSAPAYNLPISNINKLIIKANKNEEHQYPVMHIPAAIPIPDDYERKFEEYATAVPLTNQQRMVYQKENKAIEKDHIPLEKKNYQKDRITEFSTETSPANIKTNDREVKKESIIPLAFSSTKNTFQLTRKPRQSSEGLR